jgi:hypothetical protein
MFKIARIAPLKVEHDLKMFRIARIRESLMFEHDLKMFRIVRIRE